MNHFNLMGKTSIEIGGVLFSVDYYLSSTGQAHLKKVEPLDNTIPGCDFIQYFNKNTLEIIRAQIENSY